MDLIQSSYKIEQVRNNTFLRNQRGVGSLLEISVCVIFRPGRSTGRAIPMHYYLLGKPTTKWNEYLELMEKSTVLVLKNRWAHCLVNEPLKINTFVGHHNSLLLLHQFMILVQPSWWNPSTEIAIGTTELVTNSYGNLATNPTNPSPKDLQATAASVSSKPLAQTVPHSPSCKISRSPELVVVLRRKAVNKRMHLWESSKFFQNDSHKEISVMSNPIRHLNAIWCSAVNTLLHFKNWLIWNPSNLTKYADLVVMNVFMKCWCDERSTPITILFTLIY